MATRRRTQRVRAYKTGGAVIPDDVLPGFGREEAEAIRAAAIPAIPASDPELDDAVAQALDAQRRAEQMQVEAMQRAAAEQQSAQHHPQPQMSERRQRFIAEHPEILDPANAEVIMSYFRQGQRLEGYPEDSAELDRYVLDGLRWEQAIRKRRQEEAQERARGMHREEPEEAAPTPPAPAQSRREAFQPPPSMPEPQRSMPMAAPVQREVPSYGGKRTSSSNNTLSAEERDMAHKAIPDRPDLPKLTNAQKEFLYLQNREKYRAMVASGEYDQQRQR